MPDLTIDPNFTEICRCLGYPEGTSPPARVVPEIRRVMNLAVACLEPRGVHRVHAVTARSRHSLTVQQLTLEGRVAEFLGNVDHIVALTVTVGEHISVLSRSACQRGDAFAGWIFDAVGSWAAEAAADALLAELESGLEPGRALTLRYSPGYCGMAMDQQGTVLRLARADTIGVSMLPSLLMHPEKSISGILGVGGPGMTSIDRSPCERCPEVGCHMRR